MSHNDGIKKKKDEEILKTALQDQDLIKPNKGKHFYARHYMIHQTDFIKILQLALKSAIPAEPSDPPPPLPQQTTIATTATPSGISHSPSIESNLARGGADNFSNLLGNRGIENPERFKTQSNIGKKRSMEKTKNSFEAKLAAILRNENFSVRTKVELVKDLYATELRDEELSMQRDKLPAANKVFLTTGGGQPQQQQPPAAQSPTTMQLPPIAPTTTTKTNLESTNHSHASTSALPKSLPRATRSPASKKVTFTKRDKRGATKEESPTSSSEESVEEKEEEEEEAEEEEEEKEEEEEEEEEGDEENLKKRKKKKKKKKKKKNKKKKKKKT